jgi:preprotein translocase subunit YajC
MTDASVPLVLALTPPAAGTSVLVSILPFALMLGIFYLLVLMPMRKRQKKVDEFRSALKVGDRVITTGGLFGQVTRLGDVSIQIQIADKVKVEVSRAAIGGYQGQEQLVQPESGGL